jgi:hypothetical protein
MIAPDLEPDYVTATRLMLSVERALAERNPLPRYFETIRVLSRALHCMGAEDWEARNPSTGPRRVWISCPLDQAIKEAGATFRQWCREHPEDWEAIHRSEAQA